MVRKRSDYDQQLDKFGTGFKMYAVMISVESLLHIMYLRTGTKIKKTKNPKPASRPLPPI